MAEHGLLGFASLTANLRVSALRKEDTLLDFDSFYGYLSALQWQEAKDFFNSAFFSASFGSLAGALGGAYAAQRIVERAKRRNELLKELRHTNATITVAFGIANSLLSLKKQHVKSLKEVFDIQKLELVDHLRKQQRGEIGEAQVFEFNADLETLSLPPLPVETLQTQVFEKLSLGGRSVSLVITLIQTLHSLSASLEKRNQLIHTYKVNAPFKPGEFLALYFGLRQGDYINQEYPSSLHAIYTQTEDGIFFSQLLCKDLVEHGDYIAGLFRKAYGKGAPHVSRPDFSKAEAQNIMPNADNYAEWLTMFKNHEEAPTFTKRVLIFFQRLAKREPKKANCTCAGSDKRSEPSRTTE